MSCALIGSTGFVGGTLRRQTAFDALYHSTDIESISGRAYDMIVCAGAPAEKWRANAQPEADRAQLERLTRPLLRAEASLLVLISTVDVYPHPVEVDETTPITAASAQAYGRHRRELEETLAARFPTVIVRLPGLFGHGLKKNIIFDLLNGNEVQKVHADAVFQFYDMKNLWRDITRVRESGIELVNLVTEPVSVREVASHAFDLDFRNAPPGVPPRYDVHTVHAAALGRQGGYLYDRDEVLTGLREFVTRERAGSGQPS